MGVMTCRRSSCDNIMCNTYITDIGYICTECQSEFKEYLTHKGFDIESIPEGIIRRELIAFMGTDKGHYLVGNSTTVDDFFDDYTRN